MSTPSPELKDLYRRIVRRIHPDVAISEEDRVRCEQLMKAANRAYEAGDEAALRAVLDPTSSIPVNSVPPPQSPGRGEPNATPKKARPHRSTHLKTCLVLGLVSVAVLVAFVGSRSRFAHPVMSRVGVYEGVVHNSTYGQDAQIRVAITGQKDVSIYGCLFVRPPLYGTGNLKGEVSQNKLSFTVTSANPGLELNFEGTGVNFITGRYNTNQHENGTFYLFRLASPKPDRNCK